MNRSQKKFNNKHGKESSSNRTSHHQAADVVTELLRAKNQRSGGASIKSLVYSNRVQNKKAVYALCCETLRHLNIIKKVLEECKFLSENEFSPNKFGLVYVWVYELLFGQWDKIAKFKKFGPIAKHQEKLKEAYKTLQTKDALLDKSALSPIEIKTYPRYVRVNTLKTSVDEVFSQLTEEYGEANVKRNKYLRDVLQLPSSIHLHQHKLVRTGCAVLQGLSSCMPVHALKPPSRSWLLIDACSAPGNKTTQLAAHLAKAKSENESDGGKIFAFDINKIRFERLCKNVRHCGADAIVQPELRDFLSVDPTKEEKYSNAKAILLDPSCSGSGTVHSRGDFLLESASGGSGGESKTSEQIESENRRIDTLASFQEKCLRHALSFPCVERIVYSTCSINIRENETVVASVLAQAERLGFALEKALPQWPRRGYPLFEGCEKMVRVNPNKDKTEGFFLALFTRKL
jgi:putative methyltransferase